MTSLSLRAMSQMSAAPCMHQQGCLPTSTIATRSRGSPCPCFRRIARQFSTGQQKLRRHWSSGQQRHGHLWITRSSFNEDPGNDERGTAEERDNEQQPGDEGGSDPGGTDGTSTLDQFVLKFSDPRIDDPGLPLADSLISGAIAPMSIAYVTLALGLPRPMWLVLPPGTPSGLRGLPYLGPTFLHGAVLASCWLVGALAASTFEEERYKGEKVFISTIQAGAFATGVLILINQLTLAIKLGTVPLLADPTPQTDLLIAQTTASLTLDIITEAFFMLAWRLYRSGLP